MAETQEVNSNKTGKSGIKAGGQTDTKAPEFASDVAPDGSIQIGKDKFAYKPEVCKRPVQGIIVAQLKLPNPQAREGQEKFWYPFLVKLTKATEVVNREKQVVVAGPGEEVLIASGKLNQELAGIASDPENAAEIWFKVTGKIPLKGGQSMWTFDMHVVRLVKRAAHSFLQLVSRDAIVPAARQLPSGPAMGEEVGDSDLPF